MKNHTASNSLFLSIAFFTVFASSLSAQQNAVKFTPLKPVFGAFQVQYERVLAPKTTLVLEHQWINRKRESSVGMMFLGIGVSNSEHTHTKGFSTGFQLRHYSKSAMNGLFLEGGMQYTSYGVTTTSTTETFNPYAILTLNLNQIATSETTQRYEYTRGVGLKGGAGYQKTLGRFNLECSGGLSFSKSLLQKAAPYARLAMGVNF